MTINWGALSVVAAVSLVIVVLIVVLVSLALVGLSAREPDPAGDTAANNVAHDRSFTSSGEPNTSDADRPSTARAASQHSTSRGPRTGCRRYSIASAALLIAYCLDVELNPSPSYCGKMYHIQCDRFRPLRISDTACS